MNMGATRADLFTEEELELARIAKALGHPARIAILHLLLSQSTCMTGKLTDKIGLAQPTISQHLRELKAIGIIQGEVEGTAVNYCIHPERWAEIAQTFQALFIPVQQKQCS